jgi:hypothetical protein
LSVPRGRAATPDRKRCLKLREASLLEGVRLQYAGAGFQRGARPMNTAVRVADVLRGRRHGPTRLDGFVDASFAFAVTLLAISIGDVTASVDEMLQARHGLPVFALCFLAIARICKSQRDWNRCHDLQDATGLAALEAAR